MIIQDQAMRIIEASERNSDLLEKLVIIWEGSVMATHLFLSDEEIEDIKKYVFKALQEVQLLLVSEDGNGNHCGFMGISGQKVEMLFLSEQKRGKSIGRKLLKYGMEHYSVNELAVNEQNPLAKGFYEHMGFHVYKRDEFDEQGNPYPILWMKRSQEA